MKKLFYVLLNVLIFTPITVLADNGGEEIIDSCAGTLGSGVTDILSWVYTGVLVATPILVVVLSMKDMLTAVTSGKEDEMKKAQATMIKRIIVGVVIFFIPMIIKAILQLAGLVGSC